MSRPPDLLEILVKVRAVQRSVRRIAEGNFGAVEPEDRRKALELLARSRDDLDRAVAALRENRS